MIPIERLLAYVIAALLLAALLIACAQPKPAPRALFEIHNQPRTPTPWCQLDDPPKAPEMPVIDSDNDAMDRVAIHRRTYSEAIQYMHDNELWALDVLTCLRKLTE